ncbi:MAG: hypothetical protein K2N48_08125 [Muribaculaceae bacterium]|nr:hypothetical protein [Muribaculaceae bacterium]
MKRYLIFLLLAILTLPCAFAQEKDKAKMMEELQQFKIDFLAKEMQLSEKQKAEFVPMYKDFDEQRRRAGAEAWKFERKLKKNKDASEADYKKLSELQQNARAKDNEIVKKFDSRLETFLTAKQIYMMHQGEEKFFEKMKEMRRKHHEGKHAPGKHDQKPTPKKNKDKKDSPSPFDDFAPCFCED